MAAARGPIRGSSPIPNPMTISPTVIATVEPDSAAPNTVMTPTSAVAITTVPIRVAGSPAGGPRAMYSPGMIA